MTGERWSVRLRTTVGATVVVGVVLVVSGVALVVLLRRDLTAQIDAAARLRAKDLASLLEAGNVLTSVAVDGEERSVIQVLDEAGSVVSASANIAGRGPMASVPAGAVRTVDRVPIDHEGAFRVAAVAARTPQGVRTVLVGRSLESVSESAGAVATILAFGIPPLGLLVAATTWSVTGRALRPVEAIRAEVTEISNAALDRRVPEPAGDDEIARLARTMNAMLARLEASRDRQRRFLADAGHELRSPIATMRHELEVFLAAPASVDAEELAGDLLQENLRMNALVEDLLLLARSDEAGLATRRQPVDVDDLVLAEAALVRGRGVVAVDATAVSGGQVSGDPAQLVRALRNLVDNAERHARSAIGLAVAERGDRVLVTVRDDGAGIAPADRERVFERFTRLDDSRTRRTGGYGLGLAIVREVVVAHGGRVSVDEAPGGGARFTVELPAATAGAARG